ncbi:DUF2141 domain-containing protein [Sandaracinobacteroides hominis]|uniref:DUF2141 domain-containing protein n=1 Tax=Sandaracinobacteroides hominis TaxID=2780086 RepID=UPI0018F6EB23|nr:DUF2141 domain-containing protein [Sandaracinobacteroides hominis]
MSALLAIAATAVFGAAHVCDSSQGQPAALATVHGFRDRKGNLRIAIYRAREEEFLASGRYVQRLDVPMTASGEMTVCAPVPEPGDYIVVALHDRDANGKLGPFKDGAGFSRNPKLALAKPKVESVQVRLDGVTPLRIELNYLQGLKPAPWQPRHTR